VYIIALQYLLAYQLGWFPINGYEPGLAGVRYLVLPWIIIVLVGLGPDTRLFRTIFLDETNAEYVRTARAKGVSELGVLFRHVLKNALIPIITYTLGALPLLLLGAFVMERYFSLPGIGYLMVEAINNGDFPVLKGVTMVIAIAYSAMVVVNDIAYAWADPRVTLE
jgi:peptide/nickel transport system permease protein